jgi:hypothetical protein
MTRPPSGEFPDGRGIGGLLMIRSLSTAPRSAR